MVNFKKIQREISKQEKHIFNITKEIKSIDQERETVIDVINKNFLSISIERVLMCLPTKAIGSITYADKLNTQSGLYNDLQFNKIIRYLSLIESLENDYNDSYLKTAKTYRRKPNKDSANALIEISTLIGNKYKLMNVLIDCVKSDKVLYNKVYNLLEDNSVFLTHVEAENYRNLSAICHNIITLVEQGAQLVEQSYQMNETLKRNGRHLWEIGNNLTKMDKSMKKINSSIQRGNFINAVQTYQLYKINKNTKAVLPK